MVKSIHILGVTGSIGQSTADLIQAHSSLFDVQIVSAHKNVKKLAQMARDLQASCAVIADASLLPELEALLNGSDIAASSDICQALAQQPADMTIAAIMGMAGLQPLMQAIEASAHVAIANKEPLVAAGAQVLAHAQAHNTKLLPIDSEHNAVYQVFNYARPQDIEEVILTASGGAFRDWPLNDIPNASVQDALQHPNWSMGQKITIDSATMMNKVLEVIEAHILFGLPADRIKVLLHPQSVIHGMVSYVDGSVLCQMGASDMRTPIANILLGDDGRLPTSGERLSLSDAMTLDLMPMDEVRYPAISLAYKAIKKGQVACIALNAANEIAVDAFLQQRIRFGDIVKINAHILDAAPHKDIASLSDVIDYDGVVRQETLSYIDTYPSKWKA